MSQMRKLTMEDLQRGTMAGITLEEIHYNGFMGEIEFTEPKPGQIKVACVGDSITYGHGIYNWPAENYPNVLSRLLGDKYHVQSFGVCGRCVQDDSDQPYRKEEHYRRSLAYNADILVFMMGTNDSKPENWQGEAAFRRAAEELLGDYCKDGKYPNVYLCTPATAFFAEGFAESITKFDVQPGIVDVVAKIIEEIAAEKGYPLIDIHAVTASHPEWFKADSVHPDNDGAAAIAAAVCQAICNDGG